MSDFPATRWSTVVAATAAGDPSVAKTALADLCQAYWYPLYSYARRRGLSPPDAEDATQSFFATLLESNLLSNANPALGRLRSYLLSAFSRDLSDRRREARRQKRGGGREIVSLDAEDAEDRFQAEPPTAEPLHQFEVTWATTVLEGAVGRVEADYSKSGRGPLFAALRPFLGGSGKAVPDPAQLAASLRLGDMAFRQAVSRLRDRFRSALRAQIADTLRDPTDDAIDAEIQTLRAVLATQS